MVKKHIAIHQVNAIHLNTSQWASSLTICRDSANESCNAITSYNSTIIKYKNKTKNILKNN